MSDAKTNETHEVSEKRRTRWLFAGLVAAAAVVVGCAVALSTLGRPHAPVVHGSKTASGPPAAKTIAQAVTLPPPTTTVPPPEQEDPIFVALPKVEPLALQHTDKGEIDHLAQADLLMQLEDSEGVVRELRLALAHRAEDTELRWKIARVDKGELGRKALKELAQLTPDDAEVSREIARRALDHDQWDEALEAAREAKLRDGASWEAHQLEGRALMGQGKLTPAIRAFTKATAQAGAPSYPYNNLGYALLLAGRPTEALEALDQAVEKGPVTHFMMNNLGLAYERLGRLDEAEVAYLGALELKADYVKAAVNLRRVGEAKETIAKAQAEEREKAAKAAGDGEPDIELVPGG